MSGDALFDRDQFITDKKLTIPDALGRTAGIFLSSPRYVDVVLMANSDISYEPGERDADFVANDYAQGTHFEGDFRNWIPQGIARTEYSGYLAGFPRIKDKDGNGVDCIHIWGNNSDVFGDTYAFPLRSLATLAVYSQLITRLQTELDELSMGAESRYQTPVLRDKNTGQVHYRDATGDDIEEVIEAPENAPVLVYGEMQPQKSYKIVDSEALKHLLD